LQVLPEYADDNNRTDFRQEIQFMKRLGYHAPIVSLIGYINDATDPILVIEYCAIGDLLQFLRQNRATFMVICRHFIIQTLLQLYY